MKRSDIAEALGILLDEVECRRKSVACAALGYYGGGKFDFADCILAAEADIEDRKVITFDKKLKRLFDKIDDLL